MLGKTALLACVSVATIAVACGGGSADDNGFGASSGSSGAASSSSSGASGAGGFGSSGTAVDSGAKQVDECKKMDIIFAVDNSGSMKEEQDNLALNFPKFIDVLNAYKTKGGDQLDYRVAVTTSDTDKEKGAFLKTKGAGVPGNTNCLPGPDRPWLERADGTVADFFGCRARVGIKGSNKERPLENVLLGVTTRIADGTNTSGSTSFLREDSLLAFVIITDEDEGGSENGAQPVRPMTEYPKQFDIVKKDRGRWAAAVIAGPGPQECESSFGQAQFASRDDGFIKDVGKNGVFSSICVGDLTAGLKAALDTFNQACANFPTGSVN